GLKEDILNQEMFTIIILMALSTSIMAPPALRWTLKKVEPDENELKRLKLEEIFSKSLFAGVKRVLLPVRFREGSGLLVQSIEAHILDRLKAGTDMSVTLMCVTAPGNEVKGNEFLSRIEKVFGEKNIKKKSVGGNDALKLILEEAGKDYDLLILGAPQIRDDHEMLFSPIIDQMVRSSPCPTMVVQGHIQDPDWNPERILVPTNGAAAGKIAAEVAFAIASEEKDDVVTILNIVKEYPDDWMMQTGIKWGRRFVSARQIVSELRNMGEALGVNTRSLIKGSEDVVRSILQATRDEEIDLVIIGTDIRPGSQGLFLGPTVERILRQSECPVIVVNAS
ncbi:MAG: universal stress protein, partial [Spirochaetia bacterium]|nr:universal stress protein [Spirochaetia bacterium]